MWGEQGGEIEGRWQLVKGLGRGDGNRVGGRAARNDDSAKTAVGLRILCFDWTTIQGGLYARIILANERAQPETSTARLIPYPRART